MSTAPFRGIIPAFPTPLTAEGTLNKEGLRRMVEHQITQGVGGLVPLGGTGEFASLSPAMRIEVVVETVSAVRGRVPVIAGVLNPGYDDAITTGQAFVDAGVDGLMVIPPYYVKATQESVIRYFEGYKKAVQAPVVYYDNPARSHFVTAADTIARLFKASVICGMKASSLDLFHFDLIMERVDDRFSMLSGQDTLFAQQVAMGAVGGVLTSAALAPDFWNKVQALAENGQFKAALALQRKFNPLMTALFAEENPAPVKAAFTMMGIDAGSCVLPLAGISSGLRDTLQALVSEGQREGLIPTVTGHVAA